MKKINKLTALLAAITLVWASYPVEVAVAQSQHGAFVGESLTVNESAVPAKERHRPEDHIPFLTADQQYVSPHSPLAVTVIAAHIENRPPEGLPRQTKDDNDPVDFIHLKNISQRTINLSEYYIADSNGRKASIRRCAKGKDIYLDRGQEIRIIFSGKDMTKKYKRSLEGKMILFPEGLSKRGETITVFDASGHPIALAKSAYQKQDHITVFNELISGEILSADSKNKRADPRTLSGVSHHINDFSY